MLPNSASSSFMSSSSRLGLALTGNFDGSLARQEARGSQDCGGPMGVAREGALWDSVTISRDHATSPQLQCNNCGETFCGGATRIRTHVIDKCKCESERSSSRSRRI